MFERPPQKLSDDDVKRIMLAEYGTVQALADELGIAHTTASHYRGRKSKRAMRIARELNLPPLQGYAFLDGDDDRRAYVVKGVRG